MSALLSQLEGRERRAECLRNEECMAAYEAQTILAQRWVRNMSDYSASARQFYESCEADARDVMRNRSEK